MSERRSLLQAISELWQHLTSRRRTQFYLLLVVMIAASFAEIFSLGMIVPFLGAITSPERVITQPAVQSILELLPGFDTRQILMLFGLAFCLATLVAAAVRIFLLYVNTGFSYALGADLSLEVYRRTLYQPYRVHVSRNSSEVINGVTSKTNVMINNVIVQLLSLSSAGFLLVGILGALLVINAGITVAAIAAFILIYGIIIVSTRAALRRDSEIVARESTQTVKALQEGLGGIRDVLIDGTQEVFSDIYRVADRRSRKAQGRMALVVGSPRFLIEGLGMICIAIIALVVSQGDQRADIIPILGALALGSQRLLPIAQQAYAAVATIRASESSLWDVLELLSQPAPLAANAHAVDPLPFVSTLQFADVGFTYEPNSPTVLSHIDLTIKKGTRVGIFGPTGGGKSTLLDIAMGLLEPTEGAILVDGERLDSSNLSRWQSRIAHVPQSIYLSDASIAENVAFGVPQASIDLERVREAVQLAQVYDVVLNWPDGFQTRVGERGVRLSGGQRQRIGIARALYKKADVIILDEATSALDNDTERELMRALESLSRNLTIIMVAHRLTTLGNCDMLVEVVAGRVVSMTEPRYS